MSIQGIPADVRKAGAESGKRKGSRMRTEARPGSPYAAMFWQQTLRSPKILNSHLDFQVVLRYFCQGRRTEHILFVSSLYNI